jgi:hypothetical protein
VSPCSWPRAGCSITPTRPCDISAARLAHLVCVEFRNRVLQRVRRHKAGYGKHTRTALLLARRRSRLGARLLHRRARVRAHHRHTDGIRRAMGPVRPLSHDSSITFVTWFPTMQPRSVKATVVEIIEGGIPDQAWAASSPSTTPTATGWSHKHRPHPGEAGAAVADRG